MRTIRKYAPPSAAVFSIIVCAATVLSIGCGGGEEKILGTPWGISAPGSGAASFLRAADYTSLVVEIQPFEGMEPDPGTLDNLRGFLQGRLNKPAGIQVVVRAPLPASGQPSFAIDEIRQIEARSRTAYADGQTMAAFFLLIDGESDQSSGNMRILGHAYGASSMVIYQSAIVELSGGVGEPSRSVLESTVIEHEFGHILGLVGTGSPIVSAGHHDSGNGAHCANEDCLMHYTVDASNVVTNLLGGSIPTLDADCVDDLRSNGGK